MTKEYPAWTSFTLGIIFWAGVAVKWLDCHPADVDVMGSNPTGCWALFCILFSKVECPNQVT